MQASGVFFMPKKREVYTSYTAAGDFMVQVHAFQRNPSGQLECYALRMTGAAALRWHQQHSPQLLPGTPLLAHWHRQHTTIDNNRVRIVIDCSSITIAQRGGNPEPAAETVEVEHHE